MPRYRNHLPQLEAPFFLTDGGLETTLIFADGFDLPDFAAFPLLRDRAGREALVRYYESYVAVAERDGVGVVLETPTWRANPDWAARAGLDAAALADVQRDAVQLLVDVRAGRRSSVDIVVSGNVGPRGDGYVVADPMTAAEAEAYHAPQIAAFAATEADLVTVLTMTYVEEATGIVRAAVGAGMPVVVSFTVETDGRLPSGQALGEAIAEVDAATGGAAAYFMVNCAHPTHFDSVVTTATADGGASWLGRLAGVRANASTMSHAELDVAEELDDGDPDDLAARYVALRSAVPSLRVVGGCCGTDARHIGAISAACLRGR